MLHGAACRPCISAGGLSSPLPPKPLPPNICSPQQLCGRHSGAIVALGVQQHGLS